MQTRGCECRELDPLTNACSRSTLTEAVEVGTEWTAADGFPFCLSAETPWSNNEVVCWHVDHSQLLLDSLRPENGALASPTAALIWLLRFLCSHLLMTALLANVKTKDKKLSNFSSFTVGLYQAAVLEWTRPFCQR